MKILNLTQHTPTPEQVTDGVCEYKSMQVQHLLTFDTIPTQVEMVRRAIKLAYVAIDGNFETVMVGGAPYFMPILEETLKRAGLGVMYSFSSRESVDETQPDGSVVKRAVFKHIGWVKVGK